MITETNIKEQELSIVVEALEQFYENCYRISHYQKREMLESILGKLYNLTSDRCITNIRPVKNYIKTKKLSKKYQLKLL